ncbi:MAG: hypothetical protein Q4G30_08270 [Actinomycetaceae bacterium]|nr:hypothetical protein [Actinomycetaceae bacterium]
MSETPLPTAKEIRDVFEGLLGRTVEVETDYEIIDPHAEFGACTALFVDGLQRMYAIAVMDLDLAAYVGAALALLPPGAAQDAINEGNIGDHIIENVYEVLNVLSSLFNKPGAPHLSIYLMYTPGEKLPPDVHETATSYVERRDSILDIEGYGKGRLGILVL